MNKRILVLLGKSRYEVLRRAALLTAEGFVRCGCEVEIVDTTEIDFKLSKIIEGKYDLIFMNQAFLFDVKLENGAYFVAGLNSQVVGWIFDDVLFHYGRVLANRCDNVLLMSVDGAAGNIVRKMGPKINPIYPMLHGGFLADKQYDEKTIDILCPCTLGKEPEWKNEPSELERELAWEAIRLWREDTSISAREALSRVLLSMGEELEGGVLAGLSAVVMYVSDFMRYLCRRSILDAIAYAGFNIHLIGQMTETEHYPDNVIVHGPMNIDEAVELFAQSKIVLNPFPCVYEQGAHERIFTALLNHAVCFTPGYPFIEKMLGERLEYIDLNDVPDAVMRMREIIIHYELYRDAIEDNYRYAIENHTWQKRGEEILELLQKRV